MQNIKCILFDCMETLVDLTELPDMRDYAYWAYDRSGNEHYWNDFEEYFIDYMAARDYLNRNTGQYEEYDLILRFERIARQKFAGCEESMIKRVTDNFFNAYWHNYKSKCYVKEDVRIVLERLSTKYRLGVVSNFMVRGGIEELLKINSLEQYFEVIITSVNEGWRKPHTAIFKAAIEQLQLKPEEIVFVGDDFECDYTGSAAVGMKPILLDRQGRYRHVTESLEDFFKLEETILISF